MLKQSCTLLDNCDHQETLILDKHEDVSEINIQNYNIDKKEEKH